MKQAKKVQVNFMLHQPALRDHLISYVEDLDGAKKSKRRQLIFGEVKKMSDNSLSLHRHYFRT